MVLWKETAFPLWKATEKRWKRNVVSRVSSVIVVIRLPISYGCNGNVSSIIIIFKPTMRYYSRQVGKLG